MDESVVSPKKMKASKVLGRVTECQRMLEEAGLPFEAWQWPIDNKKFRDRLVEFWLSGGETTTVVSVQPIIDCDAAPYIPDGWTVREKDQLDGRVRGQFVWDPTKVKLYLSEKQEGGKYIEGNKLRNELANQPVLPANVLDYLLKNPHLIPEDWKKDANGNTRHTFFWGTIYRSWFVRQHVRCLSFSLGKWLWGYYLLGANWHRYDPAALLVSS